MEDEEAPSAVLTVNYLTEKWLSVVVEVVLDDLGGVTPAWCRDDSHWGKDAPPAGAAAAPATAPDDGKAAEGSSDAATVIDTPQSASGRTPASAPEGLRKDVDVAKALLTHVLNVPENKQAALRHWLPCVRCKVCDRHAVPPTVKAVTEREASQSHLLWACTAGHLGAVKQLLSLRSLQTKEPMTVILAAAFNHPKVVRQLLEHGVPSICSADGAVTSFAHMAAVYGHVDVLRATKDLTPDVDWEELGTPTPLMVAAAHGHKEAVTELMNRGALVAVPGEMTVLHFALFACAPHGGVAASHQEQTAIEMLHHILNSVPNPKELLNAQDMLGSTPLHLAGVLALTEVVQELLRLGADCTIKDSSGCNAADAIQLFLTLHDSSWPAGVARRLTACYQIIIAASEAKVAKAAQELLSEEGFDGDISAVFGAAKGKHAKARRGKRGKRTKKVKRFGKPPEARVHVGVMCDGCLNPKDLIGVRYKCQVCPDFDLCASCYDKRDEVHPNHAFERIEVPEKHPRTWAGMVAGTIEPSDSEGSGDSEPESSDVAGVPVAAAAAPPSPAVPPAVPPAVVPAGVPAAAAPAAVPVATAAPAPTPAAVRSSSPVTIGGRPARLPRATARAISTTNGTKVPTSPVAVEAEKVAIKPHTSVEPQAPVLPLPADDDDPLLALPPPNPASVPLEQMAGWDDEQNLQLDYLQEFDDSDDTRMPAWLMPGVPVVSMVTPAPSPPPPPSPYDELCAAVHAAHFQAAAAAVLPEHLVNTDRHDLSMAQLDVLEEMHFKELRAIAAARAKLAQRTAVMTADERIAAYIAREALLQVKTAPQQAPRR